MYEDLLPDEIREIRELPDYRNIHLTASGIFDYDKTVDPAHGFFPYGTACRSRLRR